jgi:hypothetical protein
MFDQTSRYATLPTTTFVFPAPDGRTVTYVQRRFVPDGRVIPVLAQRQVQQGDRLDLVTAQTLGDPLQFWRVADANLAMRAEDLVAVPGRMLRIPVPQF